MSLRVRWVTPIPPDRDGGGGAIRQAHLLLALAREHDVDLVVAGAVPDRLVADAMASVVVVPPLELDVTASMSRRLRDLRLATLSRFHREVSLHASMREAIEALWRDLPRADVVHIEPAALTPLVRRRQANERWMATLHNIGSEMARQAAAVTAGRRQRWLQERDAAKAATFEAWVRGAYDQVVVVSDDDAEAVPGAAVVPNGVDLARFTPLPLSHENRLLFSGALYTGPNIDGARWLVDEILPLVRAQVPDVGLDIVGLDPVPPVVALDEVEGVTVHANVKSVQPFLERARVALVPLRVGTGTRLKALEAMASGRPVVGTTVGLGGLAVEDGVHVLRRDDPSEFAAAVVGLLGDDTRAADLAGAGRRLVEERYDWVGIGRDHRELVERVAAGAHR